MSRTRQVVEKIGRGFPFPDDAFERLVLRRRRKQRNQRLAAGTVAVLVSLLAAAVLIRAFSSDPKPADHVAVPYDVDAYLVDVASGEATRLPTSFGSISRAGNFQVSPDGTMLAFDGMWRPLWRQIFVADFDGTDIRQLTHEPESGSNPRWSPDGTTIVYEGGAHPDSLDEVFVVDVATGDTRQVTQGAGPHSAPNFSSDGRTILFTRLHPRASLWTVPVGGGEPTRLVSDAAYGSFSPDGSTIAYRAGSDEFLPMGEVWLADADGSRQRRLTRPRGDGGGTNQMLSSDPRPIWSPDGSRIVCQFGGGFRWSVVGASVHVVDVATRHSTRVGPGERPSWLDDDTLIVESFVPNPKTLVPSPSPSTTGRQDSFFDLRTSEATPLPASITTIVDTANYQVSPDGTKLAFDGGRAYRIYVGNIDGSDLRPLTSGDEPAEDPRWSPDGTKIVFVSDARNLVVVDVNTGETKQLTHFRDGSHGIWHPNFSSDGRTILFTMPGTDSLALWTVPATGGVATELLGHAAYGSYSPDGSSIAYHRTRGEVEPGWWATSDGLWLADADGSDPRELVNGRGHMMAPAEALADLFRSMWSPDGTQIVQGGTHVVDVSSGKVENVCDCSYLSTWLDDDTLIVEVDQNRLVRS